MATISENLQILKNSITSIKRAIVNKCGKVDGDITTYAYYINSINTNIGDNQSPASVLINDINFLDYNGTILYSYTKEQFLALSAMPELPTKDGLICQGWNWTLDEAKEYVTDYGMLNIGTMYITDDGDTRLYIRIVSEYRMTVPLRWSQTVSNGVGIDWGDGSDIEVFSGTGNRNTTHTYANPGNYVIRLKVTDDCTLELGNGYSTCVMGDTSDNGSVYRNILKKAEIGKSVTRISSYAFNYCYSLASVSIPSSVTSIESYAFSTCQSLVSVSIPSSVKSIGNYAFYNCKSLSSVSMPQSVTSIGSDVFNQCSLLSLVTIPSSVTSIGTRVFNYCYSLTSINIPQGVKSISKNTFFSCNALSSVNIPDSVTSIGSSAFYGCYSLESVNIPYSVISIDSDAFNQCYSLESVNIPSSVTSIGSNAFYFCRSLASITIPSSVINIGATAFQNCYGMAIYDFTSHTSVPTLANTNTFTNIPSDCVIKVPESLLEEWKAATNWSTYAEYIVAG